MLSKEFDGVVIHFAETDAEWSALVLAKNESCLLCGNSGITPAHVISRRYNKTRLIVENGVPLCVKCHNWFDSLSGDKYESVAVLLVGEVFYLLRRISEMRESVKKWM